MSTCVRAARRRRWGGWGAGVCLALGAGAMSGCADQNDSVATEDRDQPILAGAVAFVQPVFEGAADVVEPVVDGAVAVVKGTVGVGRGLLNLVFLDGGGHVGERDAAVVAQGRATGDPNTGTFIVSVVNAFLPK